jgi:hypothetical protein
MIMADTALTTQDPKAHQYNEQIQHSYKLKSKKKKNGYSEDLTNLVAKKSFFKICIQSAFSSG